MNSAGALTSAVMGAVSDAQTQQLNLAAQTSPEAAQALEAAAPAMQAQLGLLKQLLTFEGNAITQLLQPLSAGTGTGTGTSVDYRV